MLLREWVTQQVKLLCAYERGNLERQSTDLPEHEWARGFYEFAGDEPPVIDVPEPAGLAAAEASVNGAADLDAKGIGVTWTPAGMPVVGIAEEKSCKQPDLPPSPPQVGAATEPGLQFVAERDEVPAAVVPSPVAGPASG